MKCRHLLSIVAGLSFMASCVPTERAQELDGATTLEGVWRITEVSFMSADTSWTSNDPDHGLYMFHGRHYSAMLVPATSPRALFSDEWTDDERLVAFDNFVANSGTFNVTGSTLTVRPMVAKVPNSMAGGEYSYEFVQDDDSLLLTLKAAWIPSGAEARYRLVRMQ